jgi:hypothetical protein
LATIAIIIKLFSDFAIVFLLDELILFLFELFQKLCGFQVSAEWAFNATLGRQFVFCPLGEAF